MSPLLRICTCGALTKRTPCPTCRTTRGSNHTTNHPVYTSAKWRALKRSILRHADTCERCGLPPTPDDPLTLGHIEPFNGRHDPLAYDPANVQPEHRSCNGREAQARQPRRRT